MRKILLFLALLLAILFLAYFLILQPRLPVITAFSARAMCTCTFIAGRSQENIQAEDLGFSPIDLSSTSLDLEKKEATSSVWGLAPKTAVYKEGLGCVLLHGKDDYQIKYPNGPTAVNSQSALDWPYGQRVIIQPTKGLDGSTLDNILDSFFIPAYETRALLVVHRDTLVAERYAKGIDATTPQLGWSMTKSIFNALIGIIVKNDQLHPEQSHLFDDWKTDSRKNIKLKHLLQMNSGLEWSEDYGGLSDANKMLFLEEDIVRYAKSKPLKHPPGSWWLYSSGSTNLLGGIIRKTLANDQAYLTFPKNVLFDKLGMHSAFIEVDESGNFLASSYAYATARDWAKFGLLYLHQGNWNGEEILSKDWIDFTRTAVPGSNGQYGAQFWLNLEGAEYPDAPRDMFFADGYQGQRIFIFPTQKLVVVRLGLSNAIPFNHLLKKLLETIPHEN